MFVDKALKFDGKKFISARQAAEIFGYTSDYVGQLCRAKKVDSRLVGRSWYVCEKDIINYKNSLHLVGSVAKKSLKPKVSKKRSEDEDSNKKTETITPASLAKKPLELTKTTHHFHSYKRLESSKSRMAEFGGKNILYSKDEKELFPRLIKKVDFGYTKYVVEESLKKLSATPKRSPIEKFVISAATVALLLVSLSGVFFKDNHPRKATIGSLGSKAKEELVILYNPSLDKWRGVFSGIEENLSNAVKGRSQFASSILSASNFASVSGWLKDTAYKILKPWLEDDQPIIVENEKESLVTAAPAYLSQTAPAQAKTVYVTGTDREYVDFKIAELKNYFLTLPSYSTVAPNVNRFYITRQNDAIVDRLSRSISATPSTVTSVSDASALSDLSDLSLGPLAYGDLVMYDGSNWVNVATSSLGISGLGEVNTGSSLGTGLNIFDSKVGSDLRFNSIIAGSNVTLSTTTDDNTIVISATSGGSFPFSASAGYVSTSTTLGLLNGFFSTASSTISAPLHLSSLSDGGLTVYGGLVSSAATTTAGTGLSYSANAFNVNITQNIAKLSNLTSNGFVKTSGGDGTLSIDTTSYLSGYDAWTHSAAGQSATTSKIGIGGSSLSNAELNIAGTVASANNSFGVYMGQLVLAPTAGWDAYFQYVGGGSVNTGGNTITKAVSLFGEAISKTGGGTISNIYGLYIKPSTAGTKNYGAYIADNVGIASTTPGYKLSVGGDGFFDGGTVTASSFTATSSVFIPTLSQGFSYIGSSGKINSVASSSINLSWFNNDSNFLTSATGLTSYDAFTHPTYGGSATTSLLTLSNGFLSTASSTIVGNATTTGSQSAAYFLGIDSNATSTFGGISISKGLQLSGGYIFGAGLTSCSSSSDKLIWNAATGQFGCGADAGAGGGITALGAQYSSYQTGSTQTLATSSDTNIQLTITSLGDTHTFTPVWSGTLASARGGTGISSVSAAGILVGNYAGTGWQQIATSSLGLLTTDVAEGSNLYWTNTRFDNRLSATTSVSGITTLPNLSITKSQVSDFGSYLSSYDAWTHPSAGQSATTSLVLLYGQASSTLFSANYLKVGGTASTTIDTAGNIITAGTLNTHTIPGGTGTLALLNSAMVGTYDGNDFIDGQVELGDLLYGSGTGAISEINIGTAGYILASSGGVPTWVATTSIPLSGDVTGTLSATVVGDDSHNHTASTISGLGVADFTSANISQWTNDSGYQTFSWPFTPQTYGVSTSTTLGLLNGFFSTASSTISAPLHLSSLSDGGLTVYGGLVSSAATTTAGTGLSYSANAFNVNTTQNIAKLSNLTSNGFVKTSGGDGTLSVDTTTYESGLTAGDGLTRTANDFDCDTANGSTFGCLTSADWTTFNSKLGSYDAWTHPSAGQSATTSLMVFNGNASTTQLSSTGSSYFATVGGYVGIGTTSPFAKLSVVGSSGTLIAADAIAGFTGKLLDLKLASTSKFTVDYNGNLTASAATTTNFAISNITSSLLKTNANGSLIPAISGVDYQAAGNYATFAWPFTAQTYGVSTSTTLGLLNGFLSTASSTIVGNATTTGDFTAGNVLFVKQGGSVGIGVANPSSYKLSVSGISSFAGAMTIQNGGLISYADSGEPVKISGYSADEKLVFINRDYSIGWTIGNNSLLPSNNFVIGLGDSTFSNPKFVISSSDGNVGIGTTTPYSKLTLWGAATDTHLLEVVNSASSTLLSVSNTGFGTTTVTGLNISGQATTTSNVGINLSNGCFAVGGTCIGGSSFTNTLANGGTATTTFYNGGLVFSDGTKLTQSSSAANLFWDETNKRLGVGTSSPWAKLSIEGSADIPQLVVKGNSSQNASLLQLMTGTGSTTLTANYEAGTGSAQLRMPTQITGKGPMMIDTGISTFSGIQDPVLSIGYNQTIGGAPILAGENGLSLNFEGDYYDGVNRTMETYFQYVSADGATQLRPLFFQFNRSTNRLSSALIRGNPLTITDDLGNESATISQGQTVISKAAGDNDTYLYVKATTSRTSYLSLGYNNNDSRLQITPGSNNARFLLGSQVPLYLYDTPNGGAGAAIAVGVDDNSAVGTFAVGSSDVNLKGLVVRGRSSQAGNLQEWQDSGSNALSVVTSSGAFAIGTSTPYSKLTLWGTDNLFEAVSNSSTTIFSIGQTGATTTNLAISNITSSLLKTNSNGSLIPAISGVDYQAAGNYATFAWPFTAQTYGVSTSTTLGLLNGFLSTASSTIVGNATTTGNSYVGGLLSLNATGQTTSAYGANFGDATANLYRSAAGTLKTDGSLVTAGGVTTAGLVTIGSTGLDSRGLVLGTSGTISPVGTTLASNDSWVTFRSNGGLGNWLDSGAYTQSWVQIIPQYVPSAAGVQTSVTGLKVSPNFDPAHASPTVTGQWISANIAGTFGSGTEVYNASSPMIGLQVNPTINVATNSTSGYVSLLVNAIETSTSSSATNYIARFQNGGTDKLIITSAGNTGIGTSTPYSKLTLWGAATDTHLLEVVNSASSTLLSVSNTGFGTTTVTGLNISGQATTTSNVGINLSNGCFAVGGTCIGGSSFTNTLANGGTATTTFYNGGLVFSDGTKLTQSSSAANLFWDETNKRLGIGTSSPFAKLSINPVAGDGDSFVIGSSTATNFVVTNSGRVGIGTAAPTSKLEVVNGLLEVTGTNSGLLIGTRDDSTDAWQLLSLTGDLDIYNQTAGGYAMTITASDSYVGIGTTTPNEKLTIKNGRLNVNNNIIVGDTSFFNRINATGTQTNLLLNSNGGALYLNNDVADNVLLGNGGGKIGIATSTPWAKLSINPVAGDGNSFVIGSSTATNFVVTNAGQVGIGTVSPTKWLSIKPGDATQGQGVQAGMAFVGNWTSGSTWSGFANASTLTTTGFALMQSTSGETILNAESNQTLRFEVGLSEKMTLTSAGNFGIASSAPFAKLAINPVAGDGHSFLIGSSTGTTFLVANSGAVGIGTTTLTEGLTLDVSGGGVGGNINVKNQNSGVLESAGVQLYNNTNLMGGIYSYSSNYFGAHFQNRLSLTASSQSSGLDLFSSAASGDMRFYTGGSATTNERMRLTSTGNLGIGTSDPVGLFSIQGAGTAKDLMRIASTTNALPVITITQWGGFVQNISSTTAIDIQDGKGNSVFAIDTTGASTNAGLDITAATGQSANLLNMYSSAGSFLSGFTAAGGLFMNISSSTAINLYDGSSNAAFIVSSSGKSVGIGTSTLAYNFTVQGAQSSTYIARIDNSNTSNTADGLLISLGVANASRGTGNYFIGFADGTQTVAGKIQGGANAVAYTTTAADIAEFFRISDMSDKPVSAEIVTLDKSKERSVVKAETTGEEPLGIVSTNPGFVGNAPICRVDDPDCDVNYANYNVLVSLAGQVPVKVSLENGPIKVGDYLTLSSTTPGTAVKMVESGYIVGVAVTEATTTLFRTPESTLASSTNYAEQTVTVYIKNGWREIENSTSLASIDGSAMAVPSRWSGLLDFFKRIGLEIGNGFVRVANLVSERVIAGRVETKELCLDGVCINKDQLAALMANSGLTASTSPSVSLPPPSGDGGTIATSTATGTPPIAATSTAPAASSTPTVTDTGASASTTATVAPAPKPQVEQPAGSGEVAATSEAGSEPAPEVAEAATPSSPETEAVN